MRAAGKKVTRKERERATAQQHHEAAREPLEGRERKRSTW